MKTHVEFRSELFPPCEEEAELAKAGVYGKRLAEYLARELPKHGATVVGITDEDWGWVVKLENEAFPLWIGCGHYQEYEDGFLCFVEPSKPVVRRFFKRIDARPAIERAVAALDAVLGAEPEVHDVKWWTAEEFGV